MLQMSSYGCLRHAQMYLLYAYNQASALYGNFFNNLCLSH